MNLPLQKGDIIAVIAPSDSFVTIAGIKQEAEQKILKELGLVVEYGKNLSELNILRSTPIESRIEDLHNAFINSSVRAILCATGGYNANDLLPHINWDIIKDNPKPLIGSSDITVLLNAIMQKTKVQTYFGPNFFKFGMREGFEYSINSFKKNLMSSESFTWLFAEEWSNERWYKDQDNRNFFKNEGPVIFNEGSAKGTIVGGNLCSLNLLQGTEYMPDLTDAVLCIEEDDSMGESTFGEFNRNLESLLQLPTAKKIKALLLGRFPIKSEMTFEKIKFALGAKPLLNDIPVIFNLDFGHTDPCCCFPVGGLININSKKTAGKQADIIQITVN